MRLDQTRIAIRERTLLEILDMSLRVLATFIGPLLLCTAAVVVPLMILNWWLLGWMPLAGEVEPSFARYVGMMALLVIVEAPLVSLGITPFLGHVMFLEEINTRKILGTLWKSVVPLVLSLLLIRGIGLAIFLAFQIPETELLFSAYEGWLIPLAMLVVLIRAARPFIVEIILLERNPMRSKDKNEITIGRRSSSLHGPNSGDLIGRWMGSSIIAGLMVLSLLASIWFAWGMLLFDWSWGSVMLYICYPLTLWLVVMYFSVVRFLCYLDLRIRREGWEVELIMRAAATQIDGAIQ